MSQSIVYSTEFYCKRCKKPSAIHLYSEDPDFPITEKVKKEVEDWGKHYHWVHNHQICAICGELVESGKGDLNLIQTEVMLKDVHPLYIEWERYPDRGLLTVHSGCADKMFSEAT